MRLGGLKAVAAAMTACALAAVLAFAPGAPSTAQPAARTQGVHLGVASCAGSTCHGRGEADGAVVRQNELMTWQDESSPAGAHARAYRVLLEPRSQEIARRLGIGPAHQAGECLACHSDAPAATMRAGKHALSDGVGCEACHGGSSGWISSHTGVGVSHADNVAQGLLALEKPQVRAAVCLDCHFGGEGDQFVTHRIMAAGHPRISFELDLFTALQRHHDEDADYAKRKTVAAPATMWAVGQAMAVERAASLYASRGSDGVFPEFYFLDCRTCHRAFSDSKSMRATWIANPGRPIPSGYPAFNDENMIVLASAAKVAAPDLATALDRDSRAFHASFSRDRAANRAAAVQLAGTARRLADRFDGAALGRAQILAMLDDVLSGATAARYTDYQGGAQAVMAVDSLLNALAAANAGDRRAVAGMKGDVDRAYAAVRDANAWRPADFRAALTRIDSAVARMR